MGPSSFADYDEYCRKEKAAQEKAEAEKERKKTILLNKIVWRTTLTIAFLLFIFFIYVGTKL